ncbi:MAG: hypothetical protein IH628_10100, partial [Proteobacteria bacterium]|nr:hypothetical protein [Pseudomonadota bacterium]
MRAQVLDLLTAEIRGELSLGEITGNLLTGFTVDSLRVRVDGQPVLQADRLEVRYNPLVLLFDVPRFRRITLLRPDVHLWRTAVGAWNIQGFLPASSPDTSTSSSTLRIDRLEILEGEFSIVDSSALTPGPESAKPVDTAGFNYRRLFLHDVNLRAGVRLDADLIEASIRELTFNTTEPTFQLRTLRGEFEVRPQAVSVQGMYVETGGSSLTLDVNLRDINLLRIQTLADFAESPVDLTLHADHVDLRELRQFLPEPLFFLDQSVGLDLEATGRFGRLQVEKLNLRMPRTSISLEGSVANLHRPADLELDVRSTEAVIHGGALRTPLA